MVKKGIDYSSKLTGKICWANGDGCNILIMCYWDTEKRVTWPCCAISCSLTSVLQLKMHLSTLWLGHTDNMDGVEKQFNPICFVWFLWVNKESSVNAALDEVVSILKIMPHKEKKIASFTRIWLWIVNQLYVLLLINVQMFVLCLSTYCSILFFN